VRRGGLFGGEERGSSRRFDRAPRDVARGGDVEGPPGALDERVGGEKELHPGAVETIEGVEADDDVALRSQNGKKTFPEERGGGDVGGACDRDLDRSSGVMGGDLDSGHAE
jgi:hypothetical protein